MMMNKLKKNIKDLITCCVKLRPYMAFYKMQINAHNKTAQHILKNEMDLILAKFSEGRKSKRQIFSVIISGFVSLAFEEISSFYTIENINIYIKQYTQSQPRQTYKKTNLCIKKIL